MKQNFISKYILAESSEVFYLKRNQWVDVAKGIAIILMVLGHTAIPDSLSRFIYSFHMPLFFIASGMMTTWTKYSVKKFVYKKIKNLIAPFLIYSGGVLMLMNKFLDGREIPFGWSGWQGYALWFIPVLFISLILAKMVKSIQKQWIRVVISFVLLILGVIFKYSKISFPWSIDVVPYACFMILVGSYVKRFQIHIDIPKKSVLILGFLIVLIVSHYWKLDMAWNNIIPVIPLTIGAIAGTFMIFTLSSFIVRYYSMGSSLFQHIGKETFVIVAFSQVIIILCNTYLICNSIIKYTILLFCLWGIIYVKNGIKKQINKIWQYYLYQV